MRWVVAFAAVVLAVFGGPVPASAAPAVETLCTVKDSRIGELSGLVSDGEHLYAMNDGGTKIQVFVLGRDCQVQKVVTDRTDPFDPEDLARTPDGTLLSGSEGVGQPLRSVRGAVALAAQSGAPAEGKTSAGTGASSGSAGDGAGLPVLPAAGITLAVVGLGWFGFSKLRPRRG